MSPALLALALLSDALACGGFVPEAGERVDQAAERVIFAIDAEAGTTEALIQLAYDGPASSFAWVLPVPSEPTLALSVDDVFRLLDQATAPTYRLETDVRGRCAAELGLGLGDEVLPDVVPDFGPEGVVVRAAGGVGPYEHAVLRGEDADEVAAWLVEHGYAVTTEVEAKIADYVAEGAWFLALRLSKGATAGDLVPISVTWSGTTPTIPLRLASVAITPDLPVRAHVLADARAVPLDYLHVTVNPFAVDWFAQGTNHDDVVRRAADEAGGQAFATDFSGPTRGLRGLFFGEGRFDADVLRDTDDALEVLFQLQRGGFPLSSGTLPLFDALVEPPLPEGERVTDLLASLGYIGWEVERRLDGRKVDGDLLADALEATWIPPMRHAEALVAAHPHLTRLTSSFSAGELTRDPTFVVNPDLPDVARQRDATLRVECAPTRRFERAPRYIELADGRRMRVPGDLLIGGLGTTAWVDAAQPLAAETVERMGPSGPPEVVLDQREAIAAAAAEAWTGSDGCACDQRSGGGLLGVGAALLALARRRIR